MPDTMNRDILLGYLASPNRWGRILGKLACIKLQESPDDKDAKLRFILGPLDELEPKSSHDKTILAFRTRLDKALRVLTIIEIGYQFELISLNKDRLPETARSQLEVLFASEAFLRYVTANLFFGIRFLAERLVSEGDPNSNPPDAEWNVRPFRLMSPPSLKCREFKDPFLNPLRQRSSTNAIQIALDFLDGSRDATDSIQFELWLRGLQPKMFDGQPVSEEQSAEQAQLEHYQSISVGLRRWAAQRCHFYLSLQQQEELPPAPGKLGFRTPRGTADRPMGGWTVTSPHAARLAITDVYWIACLLRADVSANGTVTYPRPSWLSLLHFQATLNGNLPLMHSLEKTEEVLRSVFDFVCELVQNAVELTRQRELLAVEPDLYGSRPGSTIRWRNVFDEELEAVEQQRKLRHFKDREIASNEREDTPQTNYWSRRIQTGRQPLNLVGLAFSGGGIRSATFNLGILQGLQEFDLLRHVDYISSVSGGGFIASWLIANVRRSAHWLGRMTDWSESIAHLRAYSNYLAPRTGVLSADTWTLATSWARNAFLIQLTGLTWLFCLILTILEVQKGFESFYKAAFSLGGACLTVPGLLALLMTAIVTYTLLKYLPRPATREKLKPVTELGVVYRAAIPAWIGSFAIASILSSNSNPDTTRWTDLSSLVSFFPIFTSIWKHLWLLLLIALVLFWVLVRATVEKRARAHAYWISPFCTLVLYLELAGIFDLFCSFAYELPIYTAVTVILGPALVLLAFSFSVLLLIGFTGRNSSEGTREWWTRFGTWLGIFSAGGIALPAAALLAPELLMKLGGSGAFSPAIKWSAVASWAGSVISGLAAGKSSKTDGDGGKSPLLEIVAKVGGFLFIVGSLLLASTLLYVLLMEMFTNGAAGDDPLSVLFDEVKWYQILATLAVAGGIGALFSAFFDINIFGLSQFYRNRIVRCYLGASRWTPGMRDPNKFTKFDFKDDLRLSRFQDDVELDKNGRFRGPFPIINCTLNLGGSPDLAVNTRHSASFFLTPLRCGSDRPKVGYAPTKKGDKEYVDGIMLGQAVAVSGAAVSSNMGYSTSPLVAFLLTMFNVRLGWWFPNPGSEVWSRRGLKFGLRYLILELFGFAEDKHDFVNVSDGGHFENLGVYELVRRRCKVIIACDAECDEFLKFGGLGNLIRICETDFGAIIDLDVKSIRLQKEGYSLAHCAVGLIKYSNGSIGYLIYFKASMTGDEEVGVTQYRATHPSFPHETTADQFFSEDQFESYRQLGRHVVRHTLRGNLPGEHPVMIAEKLADVLTPSGCPSDVFLKHTQALDDVWERCRANKSLHPFLNELMKNAPRAAGPVTEEEVCLGLELIQIMENVFMDLRLDDFWDHPDNRGWAILFMRWSRSMRFREVWVKMRRTYGIRFEYFCAARLGLPRDIPIVRV